jgi:hypothetical protein
MRKFPAPSQLVWFVEQLTGEGLQHLGAACTRAAEFTFHPEGREACDFQTEYQCETDIGLQ